MTLDDLKSGRGLLIVGLVALVSGAVGIGTGLASSKSRKEGRVARALDVWDTATLNRLAPGDPVLVGGTLARDNAVLFRDYVAYLEYEPYKKRFSSSSSRRRKTHWREERRATPELRVETATGGVRVSNTDYQIGAATPAPENDVDEWGPTSWKGVREGDPGATGLLGSRERWYTGFKAGERVVILGTLVNTGDTPEVKAQRVFSGTQQDLVRAAERSSRGLWLLARVMFGVCAVALALLVWSGVQHLREN